MALSTVVARLLQKLSRTPYRAGSPYLGKGSMQRPGVRPTAPLDPARDEVLASQQRQLQMDPAVSANLPTPITATERVHGRDVFTGQYARVRPDRFKGEIPFSPPKNVPVPQPQGKTWTVGGKEYDPKAADWEQRLETFPASGRHLLEDETARGFAIRDAHTWLTTAGLPKSMRAINRVVMNPRKQYDTAIRQINRIWDESSDMERVVAQHDMQQALRREARGLTEVQGQSLPSPVTGLGSKGPGMGKQAKLNYPGRGSSLAYDRLLSPEFAQERTVIQSVYLQANRIRAIQDVLEANGHGSQRALHDISGMLYHRAQRLAEALEFPDQRPWRPEGFPWTEHPVAKWAYDPRTRKGKKLSPRKAGLKGEQPKSVKVGGRWKSAQGGTQAPTRHIRTEAFRREMKEWEGLNTFLQEFGSQALGLTAAMMGGKTLFGDNPPVPKDFA